MELRNLATRILFADTLAEKYYQPPGGLDALTDLATGSPEPWREPSRPRELQISPRGARKKLPHPDNLGDPEMAIRTLHAFANHELRAIELMAWALLAYPDAPASFRKGLVRLIFDEQRHLKMYGQRIEELGARLGDLPVNDHFWRCAESLTTPLKWVCAMNLTFEQGNLDHAPQYEEHFRAVDDHRSAALMKQILEDEIHHVRFGAEFLKAHTPQASSSFALYVDNLTFHNAPARARGAHFNTDARRLAGLDDDFILAMARSHSGQ